jgi:hypothetical protein
MGRFAVNLGTSGTEGNRSNSGTPNFGESRFGDLTPVADANGPMISVDTY